MSVHFSGCVVSESNAEEGNSPGPKLGISVEWGQKCLTGLKIFYVKRLIVSASEIVVNFCK